MIGVYDFCGHYEWTFEWLEREGGREQLKNFWDEAIHQDSQRHAAELSREKGFAGMQEYWSHSLSQEEAGYSTTQSESGYRIDISACPSKGFLIQNQLEQHRDYCDHCMGWIGPMLSSAGFKIDHQHNHCGQCWWEIRQRGHEADDPTPDAIQSEHDVTKLPDWSRPAGEIDTFLNAGGVDEKVPDLH